MSRVNRGIISAVGTPFYHLSAVPMRALRGLRVTVQRIWTSGIGVFLLVLLVIAGSVSILVPSTQEGRSTTPILSTATPTPVVTATPTAPVSVRR